MTPPPTRPPPMTGEHSTDPRTAVAPTTWRGAKRERLEYVDAGDLPNAYASMASDMSKHPDTADHAALGLGMMLLMGGHLSTPAEMRKFIEGFN